MNVDRRIVRPLAWEFRAGGQATTQEFWTRAELARATGLAEATVTEAVEFLARTGFLKKGKKGSRAVYSRGEEERRRRPDLPQGWSWDWDVCYPRGERFEMIRIATDQWSPWGSGPICIEADNLDAPALVLKGLGNETYVRNAATFDKSKHVEKWRGEVEKIKRRAELLGIASGGTPEEPRLEIAITAPHDRLLVFSKLCSDLAFEAYRARSQF